MMKKYLYKMECITNMHVGNGDANYGLIDNEVQKDVVLTYVPAIYASGIKGALREHFENLKASDASDIEYIFGTEKKEGQYKFFGAKLLARPLRVSASTDGSAYILTTSVDILEDFSDFLSGMGLSNHYSYKADINFENVDTKFYCTSKAVQQIEGANVQQIESAGEMQEGDESTGAIKTDKNQANPKLQKLLGEKIAIAETLQDYPLPVIARNKVKTEEDPKGNLWYEEIVPHKSIFFFVVMVPEGENDFQTKFGDKIEGEAGPVQFGGNSTIGQGYTVITRMEGGGSDE